MLPTRENRGLEALENQAAVGTAEAEVVFDGDVDTHIPRGIGAVIQVALRILVKDIDGRRTHLVVQGQDREHRLESSGTA